jgi:alkyl hydroperoxide reductase subunit D
MTQWVDQLKETIPDYAKDTRLNIDAVVKRSTLAPELAEAIALAAAFATGNTKLWTWITVCWRTARKQTQH